MNVFLVEDEQPAARRLERLIKEVRPDYTVVEKADSIEDAVLFLKNKPAVDLLMFDIQLADGLSFEIFKQVEIDTPVIFTTAWDHYALKAFQVNSIDYLLKPIEKAQLDQALNKFERLNGQLTNHSYHELIQQIQQEKPIYRKRFLIKAGGRLAFIPVESTAYFFSDEGHTFIVTSNGERYLLDQTLEELDQQLDPSLFFRINRKMTIHLNAIGRMEPHFSSRVLLELTPPFNEEVFVSRQRVSEFKQWIDQ
ncbi:MAG: LytR/AlgR family response regulator transcription factor [Flavobacteriales bacterium]|jgi:DNA-binding LytR/AlgR family response regulator